MGSRDGEKQILGFKECQQVELTQCIDWFHVEISERDETRMTPGSIWVNREWLNSVIQQLFNKYLVNIMVLGTRDTSMNKRISWATLKEKEDRQIKPSTSPSLLILAKNHSCPLRCARVHHTHFRTRWQRVECLENARDGEPGGLPSMGLHRVGHDWSDLAAAAESYHKDPDGKRIWLQVLLHVH